LERKENGRFVPLDNGRRADEKVRQILSLGFPARGLSGSKDWGMAQILWAPQGDLSFGSLTGDLINDIRNSLDVQLTDATEGEIGKRIEEAYSRLYTSGGKLRTGKDSPELIRLKEKLQEAKQVYLNISQQVQEYRESVRRIEDYRLTREQARREEANLNKELTAARSKVESYRELLSQRRQSESRFKETQARSSELKQRLQQIRSTRDTALKTEEEMGIMKGQMSSREKELIGLEKAAAATRTSLEDVRNQRKDVETAQHIAEEARRFVDVKNICDKKAEQLKKIDIILKKYNKLCDELREFAAPDDKLLRQIRELIRSRDEAVVQIKASSIVLEIVPVTDGTLEVITGDETGTKHMKADIPQRVFGSPELVVEMPEIARIRASGPAASIEEYRKIKVNADNELKKITSPFGTFDLARLERIKEDKDKLSRKAGELKIQLDMLLDNETIAEIKAENEKEKSTLRILIDDYPGWAESPPDYRDLQIKAKEIERAFKGRIDDVEIKWERAHQALSAATLDKTRLEARFEEYGNQLAALRQNLDDLTSDGKSDEQRDEEYKSALLEWEAVRASKAEIDRQVTVFGEDPSELVNVLEKQLLATSTKVEKAIEREKMEEGKLATLSSYGSYSKLALIEEEITSLGEAVAEEQIKADAIKLIHDILETCRKEMLDSIIGPVEKRAGRMLNRISGDRLGPLELGNSFQPIAVSPEYAERSVSMEGNLSGGEQEQIYLVARLSLAEILAKDERQMIVLDDVLTATDTARLARIMAILEEEAERRLQLLLLTCHPERYGGLTNANFIDLTQRIDSRVQG
jgi:DNA repair exonuclease SbcCD ATPase subunit